MRNLKITLTACLLAVVVAQAPEVCRGSVLDGIPGGRLVKGLTGATVGTLSGLLGWAEGKIEECLGDCASGESKDPDTKRNVSQIIQSRGFKAEEYDVVTKDGYILTIQRIVNPLVKDHYRPKMKPVILQHGLMSSSVDWVINSLTVKPEVYPKDDSEDSWNEISDGSDDSSDQMELVGDTQEHPNSLGFYLANRGYDVFLTNSRGNVYGQRHVKLSPWQPRFWSFTYDEQIKYDLPDTIEFIQKLTGHTKLGYVGHSQGTAMVFGLLSDEPEYSDILEPVVALAPVAYCNNAISPVKYFSVYTPIGQNVNMWFATSNAAVKYLAPLVCKPHMVMKELCANIVFLSTGFNEEELDVSRVSAYLGHMPAGTSLKNLAHWGQGVLSGRFKHFDHGILANQIRYGQTQAPDYDLTKIRSTSLALFMSDNDWLASPKDVARLRAELRVEPFAVHNITTEMPLWNHIDFVYGKHAGQIINTKVETIFEYFRQRDEKGEEEEASE